VLGLRLSVLLMRLNYRYIYTGSSGYINKSQVFLKSYFILKVSLLVVLAIDIRLECMLHMNIREVQVIFENTRKVPVFSVTSEKYFIIHSLMIFTITITFDC
jgi:hypothetical protein